MHINNRKSVTLSNAHLRLENPGDGIGMQHLLLEPTVPAAVCAYTPLLTAINIV